MINVPLTVVLSLVLATALNAAIPWRGFLRGSFYVPYVTASVAVVGVWLFLFNRTGLVNQILGPLAPEPSWLVNECLAMPTIALYVSWKQLGFFVLLYLAALQNVQKELYEAAAVDGASRFRAFMNVTVPGVRPASTLVVVLAIITGANLFTEPYLLTGGGGPDGASASPVLAMYQHGIEQGEPDFAAALGVILVPLVLVLVAGQPQAAWSVTDMAVETLPADLAAVDDEAAARDGRAPAAAARSAWRCCSSAPSSSCSPSTTC